MNAKQQQLECVFETLRTGKVPSEAHFSSAFSQALLDAHASFVAEGITFDLEAEEVSSSEHPVKEGVVSKVEGAFIYGFQKEGVFHVVPGDLSSACAREPNEEGTFELFVDQQGQVAGLYEDLSGNGYGIPKSTWNGGGVVSKLLAMFGEK